MQEDKLKLSCNILVTASGLNPAGINTILSLKEHVKKIIGVDINNNNTARYFVNKFYKVPLASNKDYLKKLIKICQKEKINAIFPLTIEELTVLSKNIKLLNKRKIKVIGETNFFNIEICNDKWLTNEYLKKNNIPVPNAFSPRNIEEIVKYSKKLGYPKEKIAFKPRTTHGSRGFRVLSSRYDKFNMLINLKPTDNIFISLKELVDILKTRKSLPKIILMDYLEGEDYSVYLFCDKGKALSTIPMKRTGLMPGMSTGGIIAKNKRIIAYTKKIIKIFNFSGPINIQLIDTEKGPLVYEINTRISATTVATRGAGLNYPLLAIWQTMGYNEKIKKLIYGAKIKWGVKIYRVEREILEHKGEFFEL